MDITTAATTPASDEKLQRKSPSGILTKALKSIAARRNVLAQSDEPHPSKLFDKVGFRLSRVLQAQSPVSVEAAY